MGRDQNNKPAHLTVVGAGPFPVPGEKKRHRKAMEAARRDIALAEAAARRANDTAGGDAR